MKIEAQYISDYLSQHKTVSLEKIGVFDLNNKDNIFTCDKKVGTSPELIAFLAEKVEKPLPIVRQDLDYFLDQSRQLMNIRVSPFVIDGLGQIHCNNNGIYEFSADTPDTLKESERKSFEESYANNPLTTSASHEHAAGSGNAGRVARWVAILVVIGAGIYGAYYYMYKNPATYKEDDKTVVQDSVREENSSPQNNVPQKDTSTKAAVTNNRYKFVLQTFPSKAGALKRQAQLKEYRNIVFIDSVNINDTKQYRIFITDTNALAKDTMRMKDSLEGYYGHPVTIESKW